MEAVFEPAYDSAHLYSRSCVRRKHGKFRPHLLKYVQSNTDEAVKSATETAFSHDFSKADEKMIADAMKTLIELKGIGPATASLILSVYEPTIIPFFSDELFHYINGKGRMSPVFVSDRWRIAYSMKEYKALYSDVQELRQHIKEKEGKVALSNNIEQMAYVFAKCFPDRPLAFSPTDDERLLESIPIYEEAQKEGEKVRAVDEEDLDRPSKRRKVQD